MSVIRIRDISSLLAYCGALAMFCADSWSAEPLSVRKLPVDEMRFPDQKLGEKFRRMDAACNSFAKPNWHRRPFQTFDSFQARGVYFSEWASFAEKGRNPVNYRGTNEMHCIAMSAYFNADSPAPITHDTIVGLGINAVWNPPETGWRAAVDYYTMHGAIYPRSGRQNESCEIRWDYGWAQGQKPRPGLRWSQSGTQSYSQSFTFGGQSGAAGDIATLYLISISTKPVIGSQKTLDAGVCQLLKSPDSLRDQLRISYQQLLEQVKVELTAGRGVKNALRTDRLSPPANAPENFSLSPRVLSVAERERVVAAAVAEIQSQIEVVQSDFELLYESANRAFPLRKCLDPAPEPTR